MHGKAARSKIFRLDQMIESDAKSLAEQLERRNKEIEIWGEDERQIHYLIHYIIDKIKQMNRNRQKRLEQHDESLGLSETK